MKTQKHSISVQVSDQLYALILDAAPGKVAPFVRSIIEEHFADQIEHDWLETIGADEEAVELQAEIDKAKSDLIDAEWEDWTG